LWITGALLWAYVVVGEWVVTIELPELVGWVIVLFAYASAWRTSVLRVPRQRRKLWLTVAPGIVALFLFIQILVFVASFFGSSRRSHVAAVTVMLWFLSAGLFAAGRQLTRKRQGKLTGTRRAALASLWVASALGTLIALFAAMERA
jgi:hypothetical protein